VTVQLNVSPVDVAIEHRGNVAGRAKLVMVPLNIASVISLLCKQTITYFQ
jgi:hypothetical protein